MERIPIAELTPELSDLETKHFKAIVTLIWPFSSSSRQCALLLVEPDFRLRNRRGQVRARFTGSSARAVAETGIGIGDEVQIGLRGARFVQEEAGLSTPGRSIDWELSYSQTLVAKVSRDGQEIASLELISIPPTPTPGSPVRQQINSTPLKPTTLSPHISQLWSSPAFLKRSRLSGDSFFEAGLDPRRLDDEDGPSKKRRRKSYKDWTVWNYSARTPSPEKESPEADEDYSAMDTTPIRPNKLPITPISPTRPGPPTVGMMPTEANEETTSDKRREKTSTVANDKNVARGNLDKGLHGRGARNESPERIVRDADYYDLYAGPDELPPDNMRYAYGGDTEENTEEEETDQEREVLRPGMTGTPFVEGVELRHPESPSQPHLEPPEKDIVIKHRPDIIMPPPTLPSLQTDFQASVASDLFTPVGQQPRSPVIKPLDSSTLPMPSPFPGEQDGNHLVSYFDHDTASQLFHSSDRPVQEEHHENEASSETGSIVESSFYSSMGPSYDSFHPTHESAFTDVRFTFGMDGSVFSRQQGPSKSPEPEQKDEEVKVSPRGDESRTEEERREEIAGELAQEVAEEITDDLVDNLEVGLPGALQDVLQDELRNEFKEDFRQDFADEITEEKRREELAEELAEEIAEETTVELVAELQEDLPKELQVGLRDELREEFRDEFADDLAGEELEEELALESKEAKQPSDIFEQFTNEDSQSDVAGATDSGPHVEQSREEPDVIMLSSDSEHTESEDEDDEDGMTGIDTDYHTQPAPASQDMTQSTEDESSVQTMHPSAMEGPDAHPPTEESQSISMQKPVPASSAVASEIIDLGSPSGGESDDEDDADNGDIVFPSSSEFVAREASHVERSITATHNTAATFAHTELDQAHDIRAKSRGAQMGMDPVESITQNSKNEVDNMSLDIKAPQDVRTGTQETPVSYHDIKIESIEDEAPFQMDDFAPQDDDVESIISSSAELLIAVPEEGHKMGELQYKSVAATGPARNTRSKTKPSASPTKDDSSMSQPRARSRRSKTSMTSVLQAPLTPKRLRSGSTVSAKDTTPTSPYFTRSQSKMLSPNKPTPSAPVRRSPRKSRGGNDSTLSSSPPNNALSQSQSFHYETMDLSTSFWEPSQELGAIQGKFTNVLYVNDTEEGSLHSEHSISTVPFSDDQDGYGVHAYTDFSDAVELDNQPSDSAIPQSKSNLADHEWSAVPQQRRPSSHRTPPRPLLSSFAQASHTNPGKMSKLGTKNVLGSPLKLQGTRRDPYELSSDRSDAEENATSKRTPRAKIVAYPKLSHGNTRIPSSPPEAIDRDEQSGGSPPALHLDKKTTLGPSHQESLVNSNLPITPDASQRTLTQSQPSFNQLEQTLPLTPQLTQSTSTGIQSFTAKLDVAVDDLARKPWSPSKIANMPPPVVSGTPAKPAPRFYSEDLSDSDSDDETESQLATNLTSPSIGLSTPTSYYTPLRDLTYFLGRSSQIYHTSSTPDVLALVVSASPPPKRASSGARDYSTTLSITDTSTFPATTSVNVFRAHGAALPVAEAGDVVLLRAFTVKSLNRRPVLVSGEESAWAVWRYGKPVWGVKKQVCAQVRAREEVRGPAVECGEGEWREVERIRGWWVREVKEALEREKEMSGDGQANGKGVETEVENAGVEVGNTNMKTKTKIEAVNESQGTNGNAE